MSFFTIVIRSLVSYVSQSQILPFVSLLSAGCLYPAGSKRKARTSVSYTILLTFISGRSGRRGSERGFSLNPILWVTDEGMEAEMPVGSVIALDFILVLHSLCAL